MTKQIVKNKTIIIIFLSIIGFIITGIMSYPFAADYDSGHMISSMISDGHPRLTNWMGWYYPSLCFLLYKITGIELAVGIYQNMLYWISVCLFSLAIYRNTKHCFLWFILTAFFPGSLSLITNVANNALLFANTFFGISLYIFYYKVYRKRLLGIFALFVTFISIFIRREAIIYISFILVGMVIVELLSRGIHIRKAIIYSLASTFAFLAIILLSEKLLTSNIKDYHYINSIDLIAMYDMNGMSHYKNDIVFPINVLKKDYQNRDTVKTLIQKDSAVFENDYASFWYLNLSTKKFLVKIDHKFPIYIANIKYYIMFRGKMIKDYLYMSMLNFCGGVKFKTKEIQPSKLYYFFAGLPIILGISYNFFACSIIMLILSIKKIIPYSSRFHYAACSIIWILLILSFIMYLFSATSLQIRYIYPTCIFIFYLFIYSISLFVERYKITSQIQKDK